MDRRQTLAGLLALGLAPVTSFAQQHSRGWRIGFLSSSGPRTSFDSPMFGAFRNGMRELGYIEGKNLVIEWRSAEGMYERLPGLAAELVELNVDVIVADASPA